MLLALTGWVVLAATVIGGVVAAQTLIAGAGVLYRRSVGRRRDAERRLRRLGTNAQLSFFSSVLEGPPTLQRTRALDDRTNTSNAIFVECVWVADEYFVAALIDNDQTVQAFAVTTRKASFRPRFQSAREQKKNSPLLDVRLGATRFAELQKPDQVASGVGARRFGHCEFFYLGNPGLYQTFGCALNDAGAITALGQIPSRLDQTPDPTELARFREQTIINTWMVFSPGFGVPSESLIYWPDKDALRTFVD